MTEKDLLVNESSITFCGLFSFKSDEYENGYKGTRFVEYDQFSDNVNTFPHFKSIYYPNFCNSIISEKVHSNNAVKNHSFRHLLLKDVDQFREMELISDSGLTIKFSITKAEMFLFNDRTCINKNEMLGIYSFSTQINESELSLNTVSLFISKIRLFSSNNRIRLNESLYTSLEFIEKFIVHHTLSNVFITSIMGNKLKTYSITNLKNEQQEYKNLLFDLATASPIRLNNEYSYFSPSEEYYNSIFEQNLVSVFNNWHALSLFDSFTVLGHNMENINQTWGTTNFFIYIYCLKIKFYMFRINAELTNITSLGKYSEEMRNTFIEYINNHNFAIISYNFLPNILYQKIRQSLDIQNEVNDLEQKISNISLLFREAMEKRLNKILFLVAILSLSTGILDSSTLFIKISSSSEEKFFPLGGVLISLIIFILVIVYFFSRKKRIK